VFLDLEFIPIPALPVIPAQAGIQESECAYLGRQYRFLPVPVHIGAFAGMTKESMDDTGGKNKAGWETVDGRRKTFPATQPQPINGSR